MSFNGQLIDVDMAVDPLLWEATAVLLPGEAKPISFLQRKFKIGYNRAGVLLSQIRRLHLSAAFRGAWAEVVSLYWQCSINSEHALQAHLLCALKIRLPGYCFLCEPVLANGKPDIVLCLDDKIEAFVEIKFPKAKLSECRRDVGKLKDYLSRESYSQLILDPHSGTYSDKEYSLSSSCLAVFANIGDDARSLSRASLLDYWGVENVDRFLVLAESIRSETSPETKS